jgi:hypothetical protein
METRKLLYWFGVPNVALLTAVASWPIEANAQSGTFPGFYETGFEFTEGVI